jgi:uncharacterized protein (TIGR02594 family)
VRVGDPPWLTIARGEIGVREGRDDARIIEYLAATRLPPRMASTSETPWCAAFAGWCLRSAGVPYTLSAGARSYSRWGVPIEAPKRGCIAVYERGVAQGHVAFWLRSTSTHDFVIGGNQGNRVCIKAYARERLIGYRWAPLSP